MIKRFNICVISCMWSSQQWHSAMIVNILSRKFYVFEEINWRWCRHSTVPLSHIRSTVSDDVSPSREGGGGGADSLLSNSVTGQSYWNSESSKNRPCLSSSSSSSSSSSWSAGATSDSRSDDARRVSWGGSRRSRASALWGGGRSVSASRHSSSTLSWFPGVEFRWIRFVSSGTLSSSAFVQLVKLRHGISNKEAGLR